MKPRHKRSIDRPIYTFCGLLLGDATLSITYDWRSVNCKECQKFRKRRVRKT